MKINLTKEFKENKVYKIESNTLSNNGTYTFTLWERYGKHRVYFNKPNRKSEGYIDLETGEMTGMLDEYHDCYDEFVKEFFENCVEHEATENTENTENTEETAEEKPERVVEAEDGNYKFVQIDYKDRKELKKYEFVNGKYHLMSWLVKDLKTGKLRTKH